MGSPITIALIDDYDVVVMGVAYILEQYRDRVVIAELDTNRDLSDSVDIVLYDTFAQANQTTTRSASSWATRAPGTSWCTPGTSTPT